MNMTKQKSGLPSKKSRKNEEDYQPEQEEQTRKHRKWYYTTGCIITAVVMVITSYLLMLPGITMTKQPVCGNEEHIHDDSCYESETDSITPDTYVLTEEGDDATITNVTLSYQCPDISPAMTDWAAITDDVVLHGNDVMQIALAYENVPVADVKAANSRMSYSLPEWMQGLEQTTDLVDSTNAAIGTVTVEDGNLVASFETSWLDAQPETTMTGNLYANVGFSVQNVTDSILQVGNLTICVDYQEETWLSTYDPQETNDTNTDTNTDRNEDTNAAIIPEPATSSTAIVVEEEVQAEDQAEETASVAAFAEEMNLIGANYKLVLTSEGDNPTITSETLYYQCSDVTPAITEWTEVTDSVTLHANDSLRLDIEYDQVYITDVKSSNYKLYFPLPDWMQKADDSKTSPVLDSNSMKVGEITTNSGYMVATLDRTWLDEQPETHQLSGTLSMEASIDADYVKDSTLNVGDLTIHIDYTAGDWESQYGTLDISKSKATYIEQADGYDLLQYTLTVQTGDTDMNNIVVKDAFTNSATYQYIDSIVGVPTNAASAKITNTTSGLQETSTLTSYAPGEIGYDGETMTWNIGTMKAKETRTLTYQVKLKAAYTGLHRSSKLTFTNMATVYSNDIERDSDTQTFNEIASTSLKKTQLSYVADDDGIGGKVTYAVMIVANSSNTYTLDNLKIYDFFASGKNLTHVDATFNADSFYLYNGDATTEENRQKLENAGQYTKISSNDVTITTTNSNGKELSNDFTCPVGDFAPGTVKTLVYTVTVNDSLYTSANGYFRLTNRATLYDNTPGVTMSPNAGNKDAYNCFTDISYSVWEQKYNGVQQTKPETIQMSGDVYNSDFTTDSTTSFDLKRNDYKYRVVVNQNGELDVHAVSLQDTLAQYMLYTGYLRIDEYDTLQDETLRDSDNNQVDLGTISEPITKTAWLKIDGQTSFQFTLDKLGLTGKHAYVLTYYTRVNYDGTAAYISVSNQFNMTGTVYGSGNAAYLLNGLNVSVTLKASTSSSFQTTKQAWYFDRAASDATEDWSKGSVYWGIKLAGTDIPAGAVIRDQVNGSNHKLVEGDADSDSSLVGIYITDETLELSSDGIYSSIDILETAASEKLDESSYEVTWDVANGRMDVTFPQEMEIPDGKILYIIVKTSVQKYPSYNQTESYSNSLYQQTDANVGFVETSENVTESFTSRQATSKSLAQIFTYDGKTYNCLWGYANNGAYGNYMDSTRTKQLITESGTYVEYKIETCLNGNLQGDIELSDVLPEGLELVLFRNQWYHNNNGGANPTADNVEIAELENNPDWTRYEEPNKMYSNATSPYCIYYYNSKTRELRWKIANAKAVDGGVIDFQLVLKVVDEEVLMGVKKGTYINTVTTYQDGKVVEKDSAGEVVVNRNVINKSINGEASGYVIPFKIVINDANEDLLHNTDEITLVDEMSSSLTVDVPTIKVTDKNGNVVENVKIALEKTEEKTCLKLTVPDNEELIITYNTKVNSVPGQSVAISNVAHWDGYSPGNNSVVENSSFTYNLNATIAVTGHASLKLTKRDAEDIMTTLAGATYNVQEAVQQEDGSFELVGDVHTGVTGSGGSVIFSTDEENNWMKYDTVYCVTEVEAPEGYVLDTKPQYILLASRDNSNTYSSDIQVQRNSAQYVFEATDAPIPTYAIPSAGGPGIYVYEAAGALLLAIAAGFTCVKVWRKRS
jgi:hypothetical protein